MSDESIFEICLTVILVVFIICVTIGITLN